MRGPVRVFESLMIRLPTFPSVSYRGDLIVIAVPTGSQSCARRPLIPMGTSVAIPTIGIRESGRRWTVSVNRSATGQRRWSARCCLDRSMIPEGRPPIAPEPSGGRLEPKDRHGGAARVSCPSGQERPLRGSGGPPKRRPRYGWNAAQSLIVLIYAASSMGKSPLRTPRG
jgi:hypothetical protein